MSEATVTSRVFFDCGHESEVAFSGTNPDPNLICPVCGAPDKLTKEQLDMLKAHFIKYEKEYRDLQGNSAGAA